MQIFNTIFGSFQLVYFAVINVLGNLCRYKKMKYFKEY